MSRLRTFFANVHNRGQDGIVYQFINGYDWYVSNCIGSYQFIILHMILHMTP